MLQTGVVLFPLTETPNATNDSRKKRLNKNNAKKNNTVIIKKENA